MQYSWQLIDYTEIVDYVSTTRNDDSVTCEYRTDVQSSNIPYNVKNSSVEQYCLRSYNGILKILRNYLKDLF
jgi:hypothetical protein